MLLFSVILSLTYDNWLTERAQYLQTSDFNPQPTPQQMLAQPTKLVHIYEAFSL